MNLETNRSSDGPTTGEERLTTPDGVELYVRRMGSGSQVLLVPNAVYLEEDFAPLAGQQRTVVFYDLRNRGRSSAVTDPEKLSRGIHHDVEDLEAVRRHVGAERVSLLGHSYLGLVVALYALEHPEQVERVVQIGPVPFRPDATYPEALRNEDGVLAEVTAGFRELQDELEDAGSEEYCERWWALLRRLLVTDAADVDKVRPQRICHMANERPANQVPHVGRNIFPSIATLDLTARDLERLVAPVLVVHGRQDRNAPYGSGREWAGALAEARLLTIEDGAHVPWVEAPGPVVGNISRFLSEGSWPAAAERVEP